MAFALETRFGIRENDAELRALALDDTAAAVMEATGLKLPPEAKIDFIESTSEEAPADGYLTIQLPPLA